LPVEIEAEFRAQKTSRKHKGRKQLLADCKRIELRDGQRHERARRPHHESRNARQPRTDCVGQRESIKRSNFGRAKIGEGQHHQRVLRGLFRR
jgi:hypothetical protein